VNPLRQRLLDKIELNLGTRIILEHSEDVGFLIDDIIDVMIDLLPKPAPKRIFISDYYDYTNGQRQQKLEREQAVQLIKEEAIIEVSKTLKQAKEPK